MYKIGVIGDKDSVLGFKAIGLSVYPVTDASEAEDLLNKLAQDRFGIIYITEQIAKDISSSIDKFKERKFPAIIPIPGNQGTLGIGMQGVKKTVEKAVGADILFNE